MRIVPLTMIACAEAANRSREIASTGCCNNKCVSTAQQPGLQLYVRAGSDAGRCHSYQPSQRQWRR